MIEIKVTEKKFCECIEWLHTNLGQGFEGGTMNAAMICPRWEWAWAYQPEQYSRFYIENLKRVLTFRSEDDAIMFKLSCMV